jgi:hypothetical protein
VNFEKLNIFFTVIFFGEMLIKLIGFGFKGYFRDTFNDFDCLVVIVSIVDISITYSYINYSGGAMTALRAFRLLRVFKLAKSWKRFQTLLKTMLKTLRDISTFSILLFIFMFTYTLLGLEMFAFKAKFNANNQVDLVNGDYPDSNFNYFVNSFITVFIILTNDGWSDIYFDYYRAVGAGISTVYFLSLIIIG